MLVGKGSIMAEGRVIRRQLRKADNCWLVERVPILDQHTVGDEKFDLARLYRIAQNMNNRTPAAIIIGHTKDGDDSERPVVGYAKNFVVDDGVLCCDMFFYDKETPLKYPRRSAEIWLDYDVIDPIALLGSTPPARPLPVLVVDSEDAKGDVSGNEPVKVAYNSLGYRVLKYQLDLAIDMREPDMAHDSERDLVKVAIEAITDTPEWQFLSQLFQEWLEIKKLMEQGEQESPPAEGEGTVQPETTEGAEAEGAPAEGAPAAEGAEGVSTIEQLQQLLSEGEGAEEGEQKEPEKAKESLDGAGAPFAGPVSSPPKHVEVANQTPGRITVKQNSLESRLAELERQNRMLQRKYKLSLIAAEGYSIDVDGEADLTKDMDDATFDRYCRILRNRLPKRLGSATIPVASSTAISDKQLDAETVKKIVKYALDNKVSYDEAKQKILRGDLG